MSTKLALAACLAALTALPAAACPDWQGRPTFGTIDLAAGFEPDPYERRLTAGGKIDLILCFDGWAGFVTERPDFDLNWQGSARRLTIAVEAGVDAVLLVNAPDELFYYDDDTDGTNPVIIFVDPAPGLYDIWVGSYDGSSRNPARLIITEREF